MALALLSSSAAGADRGAWVEPALETELTSPLASLAGVEHSVIVRLGPALIDLKGQAGRPAIAASGTLPRDTLRALEQALIAQQKPVAAHIAATGAQVVDSYQALLNGFLVHATGDQIRAIARIPGVVSISQAPLVAPALGDSVPHIGAPRVWNELRYRGTGSLVAVLDTGVDYTHATFGGSGDPEDYAKNNEDLVESGTFPTERVVGGYDFAGKRYSPSFLCGQLPNQDCHAEPRPDDDPLDSRGHGTFVAAVIAGKGSDVLAPGVAPGAGIVALKIFGNPQNSPVVSDLLASALEWVAKNNARLDVPGWPTERVDVVNLSLSGTWLNGTVEAERLVRAASEVGLVVVVAAGNESDQPYSVDAVGSASRALAVASAYGANEGGLILGADWSGESGSGTLSSLAMDSWIEGQPRTAALGGFSGPLAWMGMACTGSPAQQDVAGKVALIERGQCPFTEKLQNAQAAESRAAVVFSMPGRGADHMAGSAVLRIPAVMTPRWIGLRLVELLTGGNQVQVRVVIPTTDVLADTLGYLSGRGPARMTDLVKPQLAAPGEIIQSAWPGLGHGGRLDSGTSIATAHASGVIALLAERSRKQGLRLESLDLAALAMNYALPTVRLERQDAGPLAPVSRQGAGRIDAYRSATGTTIVRSAEGIADLGFGLVHVGNESVQLERRFRIRNLASTARQYRLLPELTDPAGDEESGVTLEVDRPLISVGPNETAEATLRLTADPARLRPWPLVDREAIAEPDLVTRMEVDGFVRVTELDSDSQPKPGGDQLSVPFLALVQRHSCVGATSAEPFTLTGIEDRVEHGWQNPCPEPGKARLYSLVATDPVDPQLPGALDILAVGFRYEPLDPGNPESDTRMEWLIQTREGRRTPRGVQFRVYIDVNEDGEFDFVVFNAYGPDLTLYMEDVEYPRGRWVTAHAPLYPDTGEPDYWNTEGTIFFQPYDLDETGSRLFATAEELDIDLASGVARFGFAVTAHDSDGDYELLDGLPTQDVVPGDFDLGAPLTYDQGRQACLAPTIDMDIPANGGASIGLSALCYAPPDGSAVPLRLLAYYPYNMPGPARVEVREGQLVRATPTPAPPRGIYLPWGTRP